MALKNLQRMVDVHLGRISNIMQKQSDYMYMLVDMLYIYKIIYMIVYNYMYSTGPSSIYEI